MSDSISSTAAASLVSPRASAPELPRFGVVLAGFQFVLPEKAVCDFLMRAQLFSLPMAPSRVVGLVHSRGYGIPVFDAGRTVRERLSMRLEEPLLIVGQGSQAGALIVERPPALLTQLSKNLEFDQLTPHEQASSPALSDHPVFSGLQTSPYLGKLADSHDSASNLGLSLWWSLPMETLFSRLSQLKGH